KAANTENTIDEHGMTVTQMAIATQIIAPQIAFWYKYKSKFSDVEKLIANDYPVSIEWQGLFEDVIDDEEQDEAYGHYSIISYIDKEKEAVIMVDPYKDFVDQMRIIPIKSFLKRWWDYNQI